VLVLLALALLAGLGWFGLVSLREGERRAARASLAIALIGAAALLALAALPAPGPTWAAAAIAVAAVVAGVAVVVDMALSERLKSRALETRQEPRGRFDERDIMFARARLQPGSPEFEAYYAMRPQNRRPDDLTRRMPGLLSPDAVLGDARLFASAEASFGLTEALREAVDGPVAAKPQPEIAELSREAIADYVKALARYYGAREVGVAVLQPYHVYSYVGRGSGQYGEPIELDGGYAIAFTVEMDHRMVGAAPHAPTVMESARQYVEAARVAVQLAGAIRALGYPARAHIDGNYRVIAPLVARDAGLGEIGRMGLVMTPRDGPRVRLGVVTTQLELASDECAPDRSVLDFCSRCRKCANCCPAQAIPFGDRQLIDGALRWRIDSDACFRHWNVIGTDCARCVAVCPYSHPDSPAHNAVRWGIARSSLLRRLALSLDDLFYGRKPASRPAPGWVGAGREV